MKRVAPVLLAFLFCLALSGPPHEAQETEDYLIDAYELTFEAKSGSPDLRVTMDITYVIRSGKKSSGFKYIGSHDARWLEAVDGEGNVVDASLEYQRETRVNWRFPPAGPGKKRIILKFTIYGGLTGNLEENEFAATWAGIFRVPVRRAVYRFIFPDDAKRRVLASPAGSATRRDNRMILECNQSPLESTSFNISFSPGFVDNPKGFGGEVWLPLGIIGVVIAAIIGLVRKARRAGGAEGSSWWSSVSSCAGGGCSSCGSSCGGGCGGGCGG